MSLDLPLQEDANSVLQELLSTGVARSRTGYTFPLRDYIPVLECQIVQEWLRQHAPRRVLEIGLAYGISTLFMCAALEWEGGIEYHIIDPFQQSEWHGIGCLNLERAGFVHAITFHEAPSSTILPQLHEAELRFDFALIDGSHSEAQVMADAEQVDRLLVNGGVALLDDIQLPAVQNAVDYLVQIQGYAPLPIPVPFRKLRTLRVRRLNGVPESRVIGLQKPGERERRTTSDDA